MSGTTDMRYAEYGNRTEEEWKAVQEERRPEVYELLNRLGYTHKADIANLKIYQSANGFKIQDGITDQVYESIRKDAALGGVLTNYGESTPSATNTEQPNIYDSLYSNAETYKNSAYGYANSTHQSSYALAEKARQEAEAQAEIERKRGVVDSDTLYQQQKATYGANAEQLGRMGLNVSGYSDYLNSQAYASGMAYRQAANAQAAESKRQATYQEAISKLEADKARDSALAEADKTYYSTMSKIALQEKADADAKETAQQTKYSELWKLAASGVDVSTVAKEYGMTDEQITNLGLVTTEANQKQELGKNQAAYNNVLTAIYTSSMPLTDADIEVLCKANNITDVNTIDELKKYATTYASAIGADTEDTKPEKYEGYASLSDIDKAFNALDITEDEMKQHKEKLVQNSVNQVNTFITQGDIVGANAKADELYNSDKMDKATYQAKKAELAQKNIEGIETFDDYETVKKDLKKMLKNEQIDNNQYNSLINNLSNSLNISTTKLPGQLKGSATVVISVGNTGKSHKQSISLGVAPTKALNKLTEHTNLQGEIVEYDGLLYLYDNGTWCTVLSRGGSVGNTTLYEMLSNGYKFAKIK